MEQANSKHEESVPHTSKEVETGCSSMHNNSSGEQILEQASVSNTQPVTVASNSSECDLQTIPEQCVEGAVQENKDSDSSGEQILEQASVSNTQPVTVASNSSEYDLQTIPEQCVEGAVQENKDSDSSGEQILEQASVSNTRPVTVASNSSECDMQTIPEQCVEGAVQENKDSDSSGEQILEQASVSNTQPVTVASNSSECDLQTIPEQCVEGAVQENMDSDSSGEQILEQASVSNTQPVTVASNSSECDLQTISEQCVEGAVQENKDSDSSSEQILEQASVSNTRPVTVASNSSECDLQTIPEQCVEGAVQENKDSDSSGEQILEQASVSNTQPVTVASNSSECDMQTIPEQCVEGAVQENKDSDSSGEQILEQASVSNTQPVTVASNSSECDLQTISEQCVEGAVQENKDSDSINLDITSNGGDHVAAIDTTVDNVESRNIHDVPTESPNSDNVNGELSSNACAGLEQPPDKRQKMEEVGDQSSATGGNNETVGVDNVHAISGDVVECQNDDNSVAEPSGNECEVDDSELPIATDSVEQGKGSDDSIGIYALYISAENVTGECPDIAGKPSSNVGASAEPPCQALNDQSHAPLPVQFGGPKSHFSNFYPCHIRVFARYFNSSEHAYQYRQAIFHEDFESAEIIRDAEDARAAKRESKRIYKKNNGWEEKRVEVMREILKAKSEVHEFKEALLATGRAELVEYVPSWDGFWGVGSGYVGGQNMLGRLLMELREELVTPGRFDGHSSRDVYEDSNQGRQWTPRSVRSQRRRQNGNRWGPNEHRRYNERDTDWQREDNRNTGRKGSRGYRAGNYDSQNGRKSYNQWDKNGDRRANNREREDQEYSSRRREQHSNREDNESSQVREDTEDSQYKKKVMLEDEDMTTRRTSDYRPDNDDRRYRKKHNHHREENEGRRADNREIENKEDWCTRRGQPSNREVNEPSQVRDHSKDMSHGKEHSATEGNEDMSHGKGLRSREATEDIPCSTGRSMTVFPEHTAGGDGGRYYKKDVQEDEGSRKTKKKKRKGEKKGRK